MITRVGAMAVISSEDRQRVLLHRREIFFLWDLPGGGVERNESADAAAVRETREETGYEIHIERFVGKYLHQSVYSAGDQLTHVYRAHLIGGQPKEFSLETTGSLWFPGNPFAYMPCSTTPAGPIASGPCDASARPPF